MATAERVSKNESLFREVNERIKELNQSFESGAPSNVADFVCECSQEDCHDYVQLTLPEYEAVRAHSNCFVIAPGHAWVPDSEREVDRGERYSVVEKVGRAGQLASEADPRGTQ